MAHAKSRLASEFNLFFVMQLDLVNKEGVCLFLESLDHVS